MIRRKQKQCRNNHVYTGYESEGCPHCIRLFRDLENRRLELTPVTNTHLKSSFATFFPVFDRLHSLLESISPLAHKGYITGYAKINFNQRISQLISKGFSGYCDEYEFDFSSSESVVYLDYFNGWDGGFRMGWQNCIKSDIENAFGLNLHDGCNDIAFPGNLVIYDPTGWYFGFRRA